MGAAAANKAAVGNSSQIWSQPPGTGKSRSKLATVYCLAKVHKHKKFTIFYPTQLLLDTDSSAWANLVTHLNVTVERIVVRAVDKISPTSVVIFDEGDYALFDCFDWLSQKIKFPSVKTIIAFTATTKKFAQTVRSTESAFLELAGF